MTFYRPGRAQKLNQKDLLSPFQGAKARPKIKFKLNIFYFILQKAQKVLCSKRKNDKSASGNFPTPISLQCTCSHRCMHISCRVMGQDEARRTTCHCRSFSQQE
jgi:hypothetical protein